MHILCIHVMLIVGTNSLLTTCVLRSDSYTASMHGGEHFTYNVYVYAFYLYIASITMETVPLYSNFIMYKALATYKTLATDAIMVKT